jgi:hypothetical protein
VGSFPWGVGRIGWDVKVISCRDRVIGSVHPPACLMHISVVIHDMKDVENYRKGTCFMNRYCSIYFLYCCGQWVFTDL